MYVCIYYATLNTFPSKDEIRKQTVPVKTQLVVLHVQIMVTKYRNCADPIITMVKKIQQAYKKTDSS
jgi:hypothetical protein